MEANAQVRATIRSQLVALGARVIAGGSYAHYMCHRPLAFKLATILCHLHLRNALVMATALNPEDHNRDEAVAAARGAAEPPNDYIHIPQSFADFSVPSQSAIPGYPPYASGDQLITNTDMPDLPDSDSISSSGSS